MGAFYFNGSITLESPETGGRVTYSGAEACTMFVNGLGELGGNVRHMGGVFYSQNKDKTWAEFAEMIRNALRDPGEPCGESASRRWSEGGASVARERCEGRGRRTYG